MDHMVTNIAPFYISEGKKISSLIQIVGGPKNVFEKAPITKIEDSVNKIVKKYKIAAWGDNNKYPEELQTFIKSNALLKRSLKFRMDAHYGKGPFVFQELVEDDKIIYKPTKDTEITEFFKLNNIDLFQHQLISDYEQLANIFIVVILSKTNRNKIERVYRQHATHCRWEEMDDKGNIKNAYIADWRSTKLTPEQIISIPVLDKYDPVGDLRARKSGYKFMLQIKNEHFDDLYYDEPIWDPVTKTWLPIANAVPGLKLALMKNQMVLKYHIKIPYKWLNKKVKALALDTEEKINNFIKEFMSGMESYLSDTENYGKTFVSFFGKDKIDLQSEIEKWEIDVLDNKLKQEEHLPDAKAANSEIVTATGVDPALIGGFLPGGSEAGSGSNKREAYWIHQAQLSPDRMITSAWFKIIAQYNNWGDDLVMQYRNIDTSQTLDKNPTGTKTTL